ncbi:MAG: subtype I-C CRISPR-associated endonuclease Cas1 [Deltaproteobacteria bacterium RIFOXYD12_FULL_57_12]|nr:MAG: subtype I-C CRISPR-associated endonuclease Cas1 [Deltaproteobacteria bacterium RIFOXYD12_FULL_57_12]
MRHLLNTLYVTTQGAYLARDGETVAVRVERETRLRVPLHTLGGIVCFGQVSCSPPLMQLCAERGVRISFLSEYGKFWARVEGPVSGNVLLRREQYRWSDDSDKSAGIARAVVMAKVANCRTVLLRALRDHAGIAGGAEVKAAADSLERSLAMLQQPLALDSVRGIEGDTARQYFAVFDHLIVAQKKDFFFRERTRRPPLDTMNALLSFLYTLLAHDVRSALETVGLDPAVGYLHRDRPGRPSLALDLMEELRPVLADRLALSLVNRQQIKGKGFITTESGAVMMDDATRKELLVAYQKRKQEELQHPFINEKVALGLLPFVQAMLLSRYLRGDLDGYPPFFWK